MFKKIKQKLEKRLTERTLGKTQLKNISFTISKESAVDFNTVFPNNLRWSPEQLKLREEIKNGGYDPSIGGHPTITVDNVCIDGHHRLSSLIEYTNIEDEVIVEVSDEKYNFIFWFGILYVLFFGEDK